MTAMRGGWPIKFVIPDEATPSLVILSGAPQKRLFTTNGWARSRKIPRIFRTYLQPQGVLFRLFRANALTLHGNTGSIGIFRLRARQPLKTTFSTRSAQDDRCVLYCTI